MKKLICTVLSFILLLSVVSCQKNDEPVSVTKTYFDGIEFTITLDKDSYDLGDTIVATADIVNKTEGTIKLYSSTSAPYIGIGFSEDGAGKLSNKILSFATVIRTTEIQPGEGFTFTKSFNTSASFGTDEPVRSDTEWKIKSLVSVIPNGHETHEDISVEIIVPH
ncbi:MAG: hypothetical protein E7578_03005 [Ruminococcaceae bacterium]|nr:hypothetical protein [Oscillospiraceae bacterium]